jgi:hypothetical protein
MQAFRFETRISKKGIIQLPFNQELFDREVEIIILPKTELKTNENASVDFVNKWAGFLSQMTDDSKYQYLSDKYK